MKKISYLAVFLGITLLSCSKDDSDSADVVDSQDAYTSQEAQQYQEDISNESAMDKFLRVYLGAQSTQRQSENSQSSNLRTAVFVDGIGEIDLCEAYSNGNVSDPGFETCYTETNSCTNDVLTTVHDFHDGCASSSDPSVPSNFGKIILKSDLAGVFTGVILSEFEYIDYGTVGDPSILNGVGSSTTTSNNVSNTVINFNIQEPGEKITYSMSAEIIISQQGTGTMENTFVGESDFGYTVTGNTVGVVYSRSDCQNSVVGTLFTNVSGIEEHTLTQDGVSHKFTIDYGDGTCDNYYTVSDEFGLTVTVDNITGQVTYP